MAKIKTAKVVANPETGVMVTPRVNNPEYGVIRIDQVVISTVNNYRQARKRTAFISGTVAQLEMEEWQDGDEYDAGLIQKRMSFDKFYESQKDPMKIPATDTEPEKILLFDEDGNISETGKQAYSEYVFIEDATLATHQLDVWVKPLPKTVEKKAKLNVTGLQDL